LNSSAQTAATTTVLRATATRIACNMDDSRPLSKVARGKVRWDYAVPIFTLHLLALLAFGVKELQDEIGLVLEE
jgi:hypothetical protein